MIGRIGFVAAAAVLGGALILGDVAFGQAPKPVGPPPLSLLQIMRANVEPPSDGIWAAASEDKLSDPQWLLVEQDATNLVASATFTSSAGTGPKDKGWQANANYQGWARDLQDTGLKILAAAKAKDMMALQTQGDHLAEVCQNCHDKYRPSEPSDGVARFPFYPYRVIKPAQ